MDYPGGLLSGLAALAAIGAGVFVWTLRDAPAEAWRIYLVNFVLCMGVCSGAVALAAILEVSGARWPWLARRSAECFSAALPAVLMLFLISALGSATLMPWAAPDSGVRKPWLDVTSIYLRNGLGLLGLMATGMAFTRKSTYAGVGSARGLAMGYLFAYVIVSSVLAIDLLMALEPHFVSSLFGGHFFSGNLYAGIAGAMAMCVAAARWLGAASHLTLASRERSRSNMGKMLFSFAMIWMYMFWSQHIAIWYGNLPQETGYMTLRLNSQPWQTFSYIVLLLNFILPFLLLIPRAAKLNQPLLLTLSIGVIAGTWLERFIMAAPPLLASGEAPFSLRGALISTGFIAAFLLLVLTSMRRVSILEVSRARASE